MKNFLAAALLCGMLFAAAGCNDEQETQTELIGEKLAQARAARDLGDYFLREEYYTAAQEHYKQAVKNANQALAYDESNREITDFLSATWAILRGETITQGCQGKLPIEGEWILPEEYLKKSLAKIENDVEAETRTLLETNWAALTNMENKSAWAESEEGRNIIATGKKALPFLAEKIRNDYFKALAAQAAFAIPERGDVMRCLLLTSLNNYSKDVVLAAIEAAPLFADKSITVALLDKVADKKALVTEAAIKSIILLNSDLGRHVLADMLFENPGDKNIKGYILANLYLFEDNSAVDLLINFINQNDKDLMLAAARSLLKMRSDKAMPALNTVLKNYEYFQRTGTDRTDLLIEIIDRIGEAKYAAAAANLEAIFTSDVFVADDPLRAAIEALNSIADVDDNALDTLLGLLMRNSTRNKQDRFWKEIAGCVVSHKNEKVMRALIETLAVCERETAIKIAYTLGRCGDDAGVGALAAAFEKFQKYGAKETILPVIYNALTTIGSEKSIDKIFALAAQVSGNEDFVSEIADNISADEASSKKTHEFIFRNLRGDNINFALQVLASFEKSAPPAAAPYIRALVEDDKAAMEIRLGATGALRPYLDNLDETAADNTIRTIENIIKALERTPNQHLYFVAQKYLREFKSPKLTKFYLQLLSDPESGNWKLHSLAAECLLERKGDLAMEPFLDEIDALREDYVEHKDFLTAVKLAEFDKDPYTTRLSIRDKYIEEAKRIFDGEKHPLEGGLLATLSDIAEILNEEYETLAQTATDANAQAVAAEYKFAHFPDSGILVMFNNTDGVADADEAAQSQVVKAIAYLPGCKFDFYGIENGDDINAIAPMLNPQKRIDQIAYVMEYRTYVLDYGFVGINDSPDRKLMFITERTDDGKEAILYAAESLTEKLDVRIIDLMALFDIASRIAAQAQPMP